MTDDWATNYRSYPAPLEEWDIGGVHQLTLLVKHGLRRWHRLLDVGCGPVRAGRLFMVYLDHGNYSGIEPNQEMFQKGVDAEIGMELIHKREASFIFSDQFPCQEFNRRFDYILAQSIWTHCSLSQIEMCLRNARAAIARDGQFFASFEEGVRDSTNAGWVYPHGTQYRDSTLRSLAEKAGWTWQRLTDRHNSGILQWVLLRPTEQAST